MPGSINGFGTTYYGEAEHREDGSFVTTEWFILACIPVIPTRSLRLIRDKGADTNLLIYQSMGFRIIEESSLNLKQVFSVYLFVGLAAIWWPGTFWLFMFQLMPRLQGHEAQVMGGMLACLCMPFGVVAWLRFKSERAALKRR